MTWIPLIAAAVIGIALAYGFATLVINIRREDKAMSLRHRPATAANSMTRMVTGCYARGANSAASSLPERDVPLDLAPHYATR